MMLPLRHAERLTDSKCSQEAPVTIMYSLGKQAPAPAEPRTPEGDRHERIIITADLYHTASLCQTLL